MARKRKSVDKPPPSETTPLDFDWQSTLPVAPIPNRGVGLLVSDEIRRRILLVDPSLARRYRQHPGE